MINCIVRIREKNSKYYTRTGSVVREAHNQVCVCVTGGWEHGIWFFKNKVTKLRRK